MSLLDVQRSLVGFARGSTIEYQNCNNLTHAEQDWLKQVLDSPGLQVTQQTQQWWRISRLCSAAPMTLALIRREGLEKLLYEYITCEPVRTLFFAAELEQFNYFLQNHPEANNTIKTLAAFEFAIKNAYQASVCKENIMHDNNLMTKDQRLHFKRDPIKLLSALLTGTALPPETQDYYVVVSPVLPQYWRLATEEESEIAKQSLKSNRKIPAVDISVLRQP